MVDSRVGFAFSHYEFNRRHCRNMMQKVRTVDFDALAAELRKLRENVAGVTDAVLAAVDGIPIIADAADGIDPAKLSALAAADLGIARQAAEVCGQGTLNQTVVFSSDGYMAVYAIGRL